MIANIQGPKNRIHRKINHAHFANSFINTKFKFNIQFMSASTVQTESKEACFNCRGAARSCNSVAKIATYCAGFLHCSRLSTILPLSFFFFSCFLLILKYFLLQFLLFILLNCRTPMKNIE